MHPGWYRQSDWYRDYNLIGIDNLMLHTAWRNQRGYLVESHSPLGWVVFRATPGKGEVIITVFSTTKQ